MTTYSIENDYIKLTVADHGAEIRSIIRKNDGKELMWQADSNYWGRTAPVLFPLVGNYYEKKSLYGGNTYEMGQHGFARDMDFTLVNETDNQLYFELKDSEETLKKYPFKFILGIGYKLDGKKVSVIWTVKNVNTDTMYFSIGGHPAFKCDLDTYTLCFEKNGEKVDCVKANIIASDGSGCLSTKQEHHPLDNGIMKMSDELFSQDALIFEEKQADAVSLLDETGKQVIKVTCPTPLFGIWSPVGKHAPFVCIEPWCGRCDRVGFNQKLEEREYGNVLAAGETFNTSYDIVVY